MVGAGKMSWCLWQNYTIKFIVNKESDSLVHLMPFRDTSPQIQFAQWFLGTDAALRIETPLGAVREEVLGTVGWFVPNFSTICFQEIEWGTSLVLPEAAGWSSAALSPGSELCLQSLLLAPAPAVSPREPEPWDTWQHISAEYHKIS